MVIVPIAKVADALNGLLKVYWLAKGLVLERVSNDGPISVVVHVQLYTLESVVQICQVSFNFGVAGQLVARQIGVVGTVAEIVSEGQVFVDGLSQSSRVVFLVQQIQGKVIETNGISQVFAHFLNHFLGLILLLQQKLQEVLLAHFGPEVVSEVLQLDFGVPFEDFLDSFAAAADLEVLVDFLRREQTVEAVLGAFLFEDEVHDGLVVDLAVPSDVAGDFEDVPGLFAPDDVLLDVFDDGLLEYLGEVGRVSIDDLAVGDVTVEQFVELLFLMASLLSLKHHWQLLLEVTQNKVVLQLTALLQLKVKTVQTCKTEVEQERLSQTAHPQVRRQMLIQEEHAFLYVPLPPNQ